MTDKELLELAAKAAGYPIHSDSWARKYADGGETLYMGNNGPAWNPLTDDGDALRLAVKLDIRFWSCGVNGMPTAAGPIGGWCDEIEGDKPIAARRAIVRAAAEIGKTMP